MTNYQKCEDTKGQKVTCLSCGHTLKLENAWADLDGEAFKAYYHPACRDPRAFIEQTCDNLLNN